MFVFGSHLFKNDKELILKSFNILLKKTSKECTPIKNTLVFYLYRLDPDITITTDKHIHLLANRMIDVEKERISNLTNVFFKFQ